MAYSSCLSLVQSFCREYNLPVPGALQGASDAGALQMRELLHTVGEELWAQTNWQQCSRQITWSAVSGSDQGNIETLFPAGFDKIIPRTFWNLTAKQTYAGPLSPQLAQNNTAYGLATPQYYYYIQGQRLRLQTSQAAGDSLSLWYKSRNWVVTSGATVDNFANAQSFTLDSDTCVWPDALMKRGLRAFWLRMKQMPHKAEFDQFDDMRWSEGSANTVQPILSMDGTSLEPRAGIVIPLGNWTV